ncbi:hypothetical protein [Pseudodesulfovibrio sp.]|uniref:hypothetical protein n=1 Tax=unclassified Pseudodesulfovibrio TaxID=2661612 RepID=UPI003B00FE88
MDLFGIESAQKTTPLFKLGRMNQQAADTTKSVEAADTHNDARDSIHEAVRDSFHMSGGHFVHAHRKDSRYIAGLKTGLALQNSFRDQMQAVVSQYRKLVEMSGDPSYAKDAVKAVNSLVDKEEGDRNSDKLDEIKEDIEKKADEAMATESQKALENETSPQTVDESLDEAASEAQAKAEGEQSVTGLEPDTKPVAVAPETDQPQAAAAQEAASGQEAAAAQEATSGQKAAALQNAYGNALAVTSIDLMV